MLAQYQKLIKDNVLCEDKAQLAAVQALSILAKQLMAEQLLCNQHKKSANLLKKLLKNILQDNSVTKVQGLYFHGRVGRGKTMLMDLFYQSIALENKKRIHFHRFMENVHHALNTLTLLKPPIDNPLEHIAKSWATQLDLLCFDEFFVSDIGDAMILSGLFKALFAQGVTLVATSNCQPEQLYSNGLQRERFLPTIALINQHCQVISVDGEIDHRLPDLSVNHHQNYYFTHLQGETHLSKRFEQLRLGKSYIDNVSIDKPTDINVYLDDVIVINGREISVIKRTSSHIWFDFFALCSGPRSQRDYIYLADQFDTVLISGIPQFSGALIPAVFSGVEDRYQRSGVLLENLRQLDDEARRFIALVDEFYDRKVKLIVSAEVDIHELYQGQQLAFEFQRCQSRLFEMQKS